MSQNCSSNIPPNAHNMYCSKLLIFNKKAFGASGKSPQNIKKSLVKRAAFVCWCGLEYEKSGSLKQGYDPKLAPIVLRRRLQLFFMRRSVCSKGQQRSTSTQIATSSKSCSRQRLLSRKEGAYQQQSSFSHAHKGCSAGCHQQSGFGLASSS